ncbi:MAG: glycine zipper domain-containing protein, partial [Steroidobacteraceae bacterium]
GDTAEVKEHLRAAGDAAASAARARASRAQDWARSQLSDVQQRIAAEPYKAAALALGIGLLAGVLLTTLARRSD